eukprot:2672009-Rhodomonas_salina.3
MNVSELCTEDAAGPLQDASTAGPPWEEQETSRALPPLPVRKRKKAAALDKEQVKREMLREAIMMEYLCQTSDTVTSGYTPTLQTVYNWSITWVRDIARSIRLEHCDGLHNDMESRSLFRTVSTEISMQFNSVISELRQALYERLMGERAVVVQHRYEGYQKGAVRPGPKGAPPYIPLDELALKLTVLCSHKRVGDARTVVDAARDSRLFVWAEGDAMPEGAKGKEQRQNAVCGRQYINKVLHRCIAMGIDVNEKTVKVQKLSTRLAAACQPYLTAEMFLRIEAMFALHSAAGILRTKYPSADQ